MTAVGRADRSQKAPAAAEPGESPVEKRRAELQKQLAAIPSGWSREHAQARKAPNAQLAALGPKRRLAGAAPAARPLDPKTPKAAQAPAVPARAPKVDPKLIAETRFRAQALDLEEPYRGGTDPASLGGELVRRTLKRPDAEFVNRTFELAHGQGTVKQLNAEVGRALRAVAPSIDSTVDLKGRPDDAYLRALTGAALPALAKQRALDFLETGSERDSTRQAAVAAARDTEVAAGINASLTAEKAGTSPVVAVPTGIVSPEKGTRYTTDVEWNGARRQITATFDDKLVDDLKAKGQRIDIANSELVKPDGERERLVPHGTETGPRSVVPLRKAESAILGLPDEVLDSPALPTRVHYWNDAEGVAATSLGYDTKFDTFEQAHTERILPGRDLTTEPVDPPPGGFFKKEIAPGVVVEGMSEESVRKAMPSIEQILGKSMSSDAVKNAAGELEQVRGLKDQLVSASGLPAAVLCAGASAAPMAMCGCGRCAGSRVERDAAAPVPPDPANAANRSKLLAGPTTLPSTSQSDPKRVAQLVEQAKALVGPRDPASWTARDATSALMAREAELERLVAPTTIVVVPPGTHWSAMPQLNDIATEQPSLTSRGVTLSYRQKVDGKDQLRVIAGVPENDPKTREHELFHVLDYRFLSNQQQGRIDAAYQKTLADHGPLARLYGATKGEYWTTWSELFRGHRGPEGVAFLKTKAPDVYELMADVTGQRP